MSDIKPKLSLRTGVNGAEKTPSPSTKLMLNHGKPNFTINRTKVKTDAQCPFSPTNPEAATVVLKSTANSTSNGYVKPTLMKIPLSAENEVSKVVLRRTKLPEENGKPLQQDEEPEFVKAQRRIAERLANQNNLDFETRKSGYFTHVMISPTSPTKQMELPVVADHKIEKASVVVAVSDSAETIEEPPKPIEQPKESIKTNNEECEAEKKKEEPSMEKPKENGHDSSQMNGSGEDEKPTEVVEVAKAMVEELVESAANEVPDKSEELVESAANEVPEKSEEKEASKPVENGHENGVENSIQNGNHNGSEEHTLTNGESNSDSHSQGNDHITQSEVNFEPKTITSFAKELSSEPNKYPDTVKTVTEVQPTEQDDLMKDMYKLKFDIHADSEDVKVIPTVRAAE